MSNRKKVSFDLPNNPHEIYLFQENEKWVVTGKWNFHLGKRLGVYKTEMEARKRYGLIQGQTYYIPPYLYGINKGGHAK